jgi:hypothetical protein
MKVLIGLLAIAGMSFVVGCAVMFPQAAAVTPHEISQEATVELSQLEPAPAHREWARFQDEQHGFSISHPRDWKAERISSPLALSAYSFASPQRPDSPVVVLVVAGTDIVDGFDLAASPLGKVVAYGWLQQGDRFASKMITQSLTGEAATIDSKDAMTEYAIFKQQGKTYLIGLEYPTGKADPAQLTTFYTMVEGFRLE